MPRLKPSQAEIQNRILIGSVENRMALMGYKKKDLARLTGMPASSFYRKIRDPGSLSIDEWRRINRVLRMPAEERERIGREAM